MSFKVVTLDQKSDEWKLWRSTGIGASDAPIILGLSPYMKPYRLWEIKCGLHPEQTINQFVEERAARIENAARATLELELNKNYPAICVESIEFPWMKSSFDGYCADDNSIMEAKYVGAGKEHGKIPAHHWIQMQHQMMISGAKDVIYMRSNDGRNFPTKVVVRDDAYINMMQQEELRFWELVVKKVGPENIKRKRGWKSEVNLGEDIECS